MTIPSFRAAACALLLTPSVLAQNADKAAAIVAFDEAQAALDGGNVAAACPRFAESQRLDPQLGTLLHLAHCWELNGQTASAWSAFRDAAELAHARGDSRKEIAEQRAADLQKRLSRLKLELPEDRPDGLVITRNGEPVNGTLWDAATPLDPGKYDVEAAAPGYRSWRGTVEVSDAGEVTTLVIPALDPERSSLPAPTPDAEASPPGPLRDDPPSFAARRWPALTAGAVGLVGAAVWTVYGMKSLDARSDARPHCDSAGTCTPEGIRFRQDAIDAGNVATVGMVLTGVGLASAALLWFDPPQETPVAQSSRPRVRVGVGAGALQVGGTW